MVQIPWTSLLEPTDCSCCKEYSSQEGEESWSRRRSLQEIKAGAQDELGKFSLPIHRRSGSCQLPKLTPCSEVQATLLQETYGPSLSLLRPSSFRHWLTKLVQQSATARLRRTSQSLLQRLQLPAFPRQWGLREPSTSPQHLCSQPAWLITCHSFPWAKPRESQLYASNVAAKAWQQEPNLSL